MNDSCFGFLLMVFLRGEFAFSHSFRLNLFSPFIMLFLLLCFINLTFVLSSSPTLLVFFLDYNLICSLYWKYTRLQYLQS